jgi:hypothetical protein
MSNAPRAAWVATWLEAKKVVAGNLVCKHALGMMEKHGTIRLDDLGG